MHENDGVLQLYSQWNGITVNIQTLQMTTSGQRIWHKAASPLHTDGSTVFTRLRQYAPHTPQSASTLYGCCVLLSCFEHIDRRHVRYLGFYKFKILSIARLKRIKWVIIIPVPNIMAIHRTIAELWRFNGFSTWWLSAVRHLGFLKIWFFKVWVQLTGSLFVVVRKFVAIGQTVACWDMAIFQHVGRLQSWIFKNLNFDSVKAYDG